MQYEISSLINGLVEYALDTGLIGNDDAPYCANSLLALLKLDEYDTAAVPVKEELPVMLEAVCSFAAQKGLIGNTVTEKDLFDTAVMGVFAARPSEINSRFYSLYEQSPEKATDYFYKFCGDVNYIRRDRVARMLKWQYGGKYGTIDITVNLSKPEKDPEEIAKAKLAPAAGYPRCMLCHENTGYAGRLNFPARQNHRMITLSLGGSEWFMQYSPYVYYNEHCIVLEGEHRDMKIDGKTFERLYDFLDIFPHYFIGSNADLPIVGGSILNHEHFQGGRYEFAMERAEIEKELTFEGFPDVEAGIVRWPMTTVRLRSSDRKQLAALCEKILAVWRKYEDLDAFIIPFTTDEKGEEIPHNTITPIARVKNGRYETDLVLRNNITTPEHPLGVYHPHAELHHIKRENIGLIEVMGLAVLPPRLKTELEALEKAILTGIDLKADPLTAPHAVWAEEIIGRYPVINEENVTDILRKEVGAVFEEVLEHAGVFKRDEKGTAALLKFIKSV